MGPGLTPGTIGILHARVSDPHDWARLEQSVTAEERERATRFLHDIDRRRHILGRAMLRELLAAATGMEPQAIRFVLSELGKPVLPDGPSFNLSHSGDHVLLALAPDGRLGVDVEVVRPLRDLAGLARVSFGADEVERVMALPEHERTVAFFRVWTRKEAMLKALGCGLTGLSGVSVSFAERTDNALLRLDSPGERYEDWIVRPLAVASDAAAALAWDRPLLRITALDSRIVRPADPA